MLTIMTGLEDNMKLKRHTQTEKSCLFYSEINMSNWPKNTLSTLSTIQRQSQVTFTYSLITTLSVWNFVFTYCPDRLISLPPSVSLLCGTWIRGGRQCLHYHSVYQYGEMRPGREDTSNPHSAAQISRQLSWGHRGARGTYQKQNKRKLWNGIH